MLVQYIDLHTCSGNMSYLFTQVTWYDLPWTGGPSIHYINPYCLQRLVTVTVEEDQNKYSDLLTRSIYSTPLVESC